MIGHMQEFAMLKQTLRHRVPQVLRRSGDPAGRAAGDGFA